MAEPANRGERDRHGERQADGDEPELHGVGVGDRPHPAGERVERHDRGGDQDRRRQIHAEDDAEGRAERDEQLRAPEHLGEHRGDRQHDRPSRAEARFERIDERREREARMRRAKKSPPRIRLMPKQRPPCSPVATLDL